MTAGTRTRRRRYTEGIAGFVVESAATFEHKRTGEPVTLVHYWYGPTHGFGTTWGALGYSTAIYATRPAARKAFETVRPLGPNEKVRRIRDVEEDYARRGYEYRADEHGWTKR